MEISKLEREQACRGIWRHGQGYMLQWISPGVNLASCPLEQLFVPVGCLTKGIEGSLNPLR